MADMTVEDPQLVLDEVTSSIKNSIYSGLDQNVGVLSLSEKRDNLLMWAHYADHHKGLVLGFNSEHDFFDQRVSTKDNFRFLRKVKYTQIRPQIRLAEDNDISKVLLTKSTEWRYENEWRMIMPLADAILKEEKDGETIYLFDFPTESVEQVIFGYRMPMAIRNQIKEFLTSEKQYSHVKLEDACLDRKGFRLRFSRIRTTKRGGIREKLWNPFPGSRDSRAVLIESEELI